MQTQYVLNIYTVTTSITGLQKKYGKSQIQRRNCERETFEINKKLIKLAGTRLTLKC